MKVKHQTITLTSTQMAEIIEDQFASFVSHAIDYSIVSGKSPLDIDDVLREYTELSTIIDLATDWFYPFPYLDDFAEDYADRWSAKKGLDKKQWLDWWHENF